MKHFKRLVILFIVFLITYLIGISEAKMLIKLQKVNNEVSLQIDRKAINFPASAENVSSIVFARKNNLRHEIQIDGSDSMNNFNYDENYFRKMSDGYYYKIYNFIRGGELYSKWLSVKIIDDESGRIFFEREIEQQDSEIILPLFPEKSTIEIVLSYPEKPVSLSYKTQAGEEYLLQLNRNDRYLRVIKYTPGGQAEKIADEYFPENPRPFAGENLIMLSRIMLTSIILAVFSIAVSSLSKKIVSGFKISKVPELYFMKLNKKTFIDKFAAVFIIASFFFVSYISYFLYQGMPHVLDAISYLNQAKIFASGQLYAEVTRENMFLGGPFMNAYEGKWFAVFGPGTPMFLAIGIFVNAPWIIMPVFGALSLISMYLLGRKWYGSKTALLSLVLVVFSPFYSFIAASYLSHPSSLFFLVISLYFWDRFCRGLVKGRKSLMMIFLSAFFLGFAFLVREAISVFFGAAGILGLLIIYISAILKRVKISSVINYLIFYLFVFSVFVIIYFVYNSILTGSVFILPRWLFFSGDRYGFGEGIGFYGEHNLAAGLVILEQLLTSIQFELFGWIFPFTFAFIAVLFISGKANRFDYLGLGFIFLIFAMHVPYYYHSIAIGPRHLYEAIPFFAFLTARGIAILAGLAKEAGGKNVFGMWPVVLVVMIMFGYNIFYYTPRKIELYNAFTGLPSYINLDSKSIYRNNLKNAVVITDNWLYYFQVLSAMNDPRGRGEVLYVYLPNTEKLEKVREVYGSREIYKLRVEYDGEVFFDKI